MRSIQLPVRVWLLLCFALSFCGNDSQPLAEWEGGSITRQELKYTFQLLGKPPKLDSQEKVLEGLAVLKMSASESLRQGLADSPEFQKRSVFFEKTAFVGAFEQFVAQETRKKKFKMMELQGAFLHDAATPKTREEEALDFVKRLNAASEIDVIQMIAERTELRRYGVVGGYMEPLCSNCPMNPYVFLINPARRAEGKFISIPDSNGFWIVRKVREEEFADDDLVEEYAHYYRKIVPIGRHFVRELPEGNERLALEVTIPADSDIAMTANQKAQAHLVREYRLAYENKLREKKAEHHFEAGPNWNKSDQIANRAELLFKLDEKSFTLADFETEIPESARDKGLILHQVLFPYLLLKDDSLADPVRKSEYFKFLLEWNRNTALSELYIARLEPGSEEKRMARMNALRAELPQK